MKWIIVAIIVFVLGYTFLTLHYRKPGKAYQPAEDMKNKVTTARLLAAGYQRVQLPARLPADPIAPANNGLPAPGGLPEELKATLVSAPLLPANIVAVNAPSTVNTDRPFSIHFRCVVTDERRQIAGADLYVKGDDIVVTPRFEKLSGGLETRADNYVISLEVPAGALKPGSYHIRLIGERLSQAWNMSVVP